MRTTAIGDTTGLQPGDIFATKGKGPLGWVVQNLILPSTDRFHFGILWKKLPNNDFIILESIAKGLAVGKLSWYKDTDVEFYRVNCPLDLRHAAPGSLVDWGRSNYDYLLIVKIAFGALSAWVRILFTKWRFRKLTAEDLSYTRNSALICTEAPDIGYDAVGVNVIPLGVTPIPNAYRQAEIDGRMLVILKWSEYPKEVVTEDLLIVKLMPQYS